MGVDAGGVDADVGFASPAAADAAAAAGAIVTLRAPVAVVSKQRGVNSSE